MKNQTALAALAILLLVAGCAGNDSGKMFFGAEVVTGVPENATTISYNHSDVAENEELREIVRKTVEYHKDGWEESGWTAASPQAVERFQRLSTAYVVYRNETVEVTAYMQS